MFGIYLKDINMGHANAFKGAKLRAIRKERGFSAHYIGVKVLGFDGESAVHHYEINRCRPSDESEIKLCEFFGVSKDYFRTD